MIQRIQTLYLIMTILLSVLFLTGRMIVIEKDAEVIHQGMIVPLAVTAALIALISAVSIFLYKNRKQQMKLAIILIILSSVLTAALVIYGFILTSQNGGRIRLNLSIILPFPMIITSLLAYRGIKKDEELVRSYDRLR